MAAYCVPVADCSGCGAVQTGRAGARPSSAFPQPHVASWRRIPAPASAGL